MLPVTSSLAEPVLAAIGEAAQYDTFIYSSGLRESRVAMRSVTHALRASLSASQLQQALSSLPEMSQRALGMAGFLPFDSWPAGSELRERLAQYQSWTRRYMSGDFDRSDADPNA
jgi:hypothetical protein